MRWRRRGLTDIDDELRNHLLERADLLAEDGLSPEQAQQEAERRFGDVSAVRRTLVRIRAAERHGFNPLRFAGSVAADARHAVRDARQAPGFAAVLILTMGLGVGVNAALFSVTDAVLLRPLPYAEPDRLVRLEEYFPEQDRTSSWIVPDRARTWADTELGLQELVGFTQMGHVRTGVEAPYSVHGFAVTPNWLAALGVAPQLGRSFASEDLEAAAASAILLSDRFWRARYDADPAAIGSTLQLDRHDYTVIGVLPAGFKFPLRTGQIDFWVPMSADLTDAPSGEIRLLSFVGRLAPDDTISRFQERLDSIAAALNELDPQPREWSGRATQFTAPMNRDVRFALVLLSVAAGCMLAIATLNVANLLLLRAVARAGEHAVRMVLGASRLRLFRQSVTESLVLVGCGGLVAVLAANAVLSTLIELLPSEVSFFQANAIAVDGRAVAFALLVTALSGILLSLLPAVRIARAAHDVTGRSQTQGAAIRRLRGALLVAQLAMTVALLAGAGLMISSFLRLTSVDPGFDPKGLITLGIDFPEATYADGSARRRFLDELVARISRLPTVRSVSLADSVPTRGSIAFGISPQVEGEAPVSFAQDVINKATVDTMYFRTLGTVIEAGRDFVAADAEPPGNVIIDAEMARFLWGDRNPVGQRFRLDSEDDGETSADQRVRVGDAWLTVVGVVGDVKMLGQDDRMGSMEVFTPLPPGGAAGYMSLAVRVDSASQGEVFRAIRTAVHDMDPDLPLGTLETAATSLSENNDKPRFYLRMMSIFAAISLTLALIGTYGVVAYSVRQRHRELGIRLALGARAGEVLGMVLRQGLALAGTGIAIGLVGAVSLGRFARSLLFEISPYDPGTLLAAVLVMLIGAASACWIPARRATRVNPVEVLRAD